MIALVLATLLFGDSAAVAQHITVLRLLSLLQAQSPPSIQDYAACYSVHDEGEIAAIIISACGRPCDAQPDSSCLATIQQRLQNPGDWPSCYLRLEREYLKAHGLLGGRYWIEWPAQAGRPGETQVRVKTRSGTLSIVFEESSSRIGEIFLPDGRAISDVVTPCTGPASKARPRKN